MSEQDPPAQNQKHPASESPNTTEIARSPDPETSEKCKNHREPKKRDWYDGVTLAIAVLGLFGLWYYAYWAQIQAVANVKAAKAAKDGADDATAANNIAQKALEIAQRAVINIEKIKFQDFKIGGKFKISYAIHNTGHLPATGLQTFPMTMYGPHPMNPAPAHGHWISPDEKFGNVIGPGEEWPTAFRLGGIPKDIPPQMAKMTLTRRKIEDAIRGKAGLQVSLVASYFDGFGKPRITWRIYTWDSMLGDFIQTSSHQE